MCHEKEFYICTHTFMGWSFGERAVPRTESVNVCFSPKIILSAISFSSSLGQTGIVSSSYALNLFAIFALLRNTSVFVCAIGTLCYGSLAC